MDIIDLRLKDDQKEFDQKCQDMSSNFLVFGPPNTLPSSGRYRSLYPYETTVVPNRSLAFSEPESRIQTNIK